MNPARPQIAGYSLVEVLVVMTLIALVTGGAWLTFADQRAPGEAEAGRLAALLVRAEREAISSGDFIGIDVAPGRADVLRYRNGQWRPEANIAPDGLALDGGHFLHTGTRDADADSGAEDDGTQMPDIWFDPTGASEPAVLILETEGPRYRIEMTAGQARIETGG